MTIQTYRHIGNVQIAGLSHTACPRFQRLCCMRTGAGSGAAAGQPNGRQGSKCASGVWRCEACHGARARQVQGPVPHPGRPATVQHPHAFQYMACSRLQTHVKSSFAESTWLAPTCRSLFHVILSSSGFYCLAFRYELYQPLNKLWLSYVARLLRYRNFEEQLLQVRGLISHSVSQR